VPEGVDLRALHRSVRAELRGLPKELGDIVAAYLVVAGQLIDDDPELAYAHAEAARRRAARLPIVREAAAETAYAAGHYDVALSEFRALRRMTGVDDYLPVMADCERALGRPEAALRLAKEARRLAMEPASRTEMIIVEAGARNDLGQPAEALRLLRAAIDVPGGSVPQGAAARLRYAYADALARTGSAEDAREWFAAAATLDTEGETDAQVRLDELDGLVLTLDESDFEDTSEPVDAPPAELAEPRSDGPRAGLGESGSDEPPARRPGESGSDGPSVGRPGETASGVPPIEPSDPELPESPESQSGDGATTAHRQSGGGSS
jgi:tetratricopeptide (TPR) repeat protein